jgi:hypothetical protein
MMLNEVIPYPFDEPALAALDLVAKWEATAHDGVTALAGYRPEQAFHIPPAVRRATLPACPWC